MLRTQELNVLKKKTYIRIYIYRRVVQTTHNCTKKVYIRIYIYRHIMIVYMQYVHDSIYAVCT